MKKSIKSSGYSNESLKKVISLIAEKEKYYSINDPDDITMCISPGNCNICKAAKRGCLNGENTFSGLH